jgi:hypothetical protein
VSLYHSHRFFSIIISATGRPKNFYSIANFYPREKNLAVPFFTQQMEKLGIKALSESYKRRKAAQNAAEKKEKETK